MKNPKVEILDKCTVSNAEWKRTRKYAKEWQFNTGTWEYAPPAHSQEHAPIIRLEHITDLDKAEATGVLLVRITKVEASGQTETITNKAVFDNVPDALNTAHLSFRVACHKYFPRHKFPWKNLMRQRQVLSGRGR